ncbi:hypothetical protein [Sphingomonas sp. LHG3443-2]|uniref:hypothetical protein n=1 Tax=Sphingomonas sp. LHG3443-2 TaxID=2804639 RepID=UPI003CF525E6
MSQYKGESIFLGAAAVLLSDQARLWSPVTDFLSDFQIQRQERALATQAGVPDTELVTMDVAPLRLLGLDDLYAMEVNQRSRGASSGNAPKTLRPLPSCCDFTRPLNATP